MLYILAEHRRWDLAYGLGVLIDNSHLRLICCARAVSNVEE